MIENNHLELVQNFEQTFKEEGEASLLINRELLPKFEKMKVHYEKKGKPTTRLGNLRFVPWKATIGSPFVEVFLTYISKFDDLETVEIKDDGGELIELVFVGKS